MKGVSLKVPNVYLNENAMASKRFTLQHYDGPVVEIYDESSDTRLGNTPLTLITLAVKMLGITAPADTDAAITALIDGGFHISIASDRSTKTN